MKIVIDMPEELYLNIINTWGKIHPQITEILKNGTPLPKDNRWIPYSERFPDEVGAYVVTVRDKKIPEITGTKIDRWCLDDDKYRWIKYENPYGDNEYEIVAWMPLPKPYKAESEEENEDSD